MLSTHLFIWTITAGACKHTNYPGHCTIEWKYSWQAQGKFLSNEACNKAATNLGLLKGEYRCINEKGEVK